MSDNGGFGVLPRHLAGRLTLAELGVYVALTWHVGPDGTCYPSHATIAEEIGASVSTVRRAIDGLVEKELLVKRGRINEKDGGQSSNLYLLMIWREQGGWSQRTGGVLSQNNERDSLNETQVTPSSATPPLTEFTLLPADIVKAQRVTKAKANRGYAFDEWWAIVPKKVDKGHAERSYRKALTKTTHETLMTATRNLVGWNALGPRQYIPNPATWLNGERWSDETAPNNGNGGVGWNPAVPDDNYL
jgi:hypothetical protein